MENSLLNTSLRRGIITFMLRGKRGLDLFAVAVSGIFHPLLMPTLGTVLMLNIGGYMMYVLNPQVKLLIYGIVFLNTFIFPVIGSYWLLRKGFLTSFAMPTIQERRLPMLLTVIFYFFTFYILKQAPLPPALYLMILGATLAVLLTLIITMVWKISTHMVGIGGMVGAVTGLSLKFGVNLQFLIILLLLCAGLTGFARLQLKAHSHSQVYAGFLLGFASMILLIVFV
jgi:hypothetical protein